MKIKENLKKHKFIFLTAGVITVLLGGYLINSSLNSAPIPQLTVAVETVKVLDIEQTVNVKGNIVPSKDATVNALLNYEIVSIPVSEGQKVKKGDTLATLSSDAISDELLLAKERLDLAKLNLQDTLNRAQDSYEDAILSLESAQRNYDTTLALFESGSSSKEELNRAESTLKSSKNLVASFNVKNHKVVPTSAQLKALEVEELSYTTRQKTLDDLVITSPIDGTVTRINGKVGEIPNASISKEGLFLIEDIDNLIMKVMVSEFDISKILEGQETRITSDVLGKTVITGTVDKISPSAEAQSPTSSEMVIPVEIKITPTKERLIAGVNGKAVILVDSRKEVLSVPVDSVLQLEDGSYIVLKVDENHLLSRIPVELGLEGDFYTEILTGNLKAGDNLVLSPDLSMKDGTVVAISNEATGDNEASLMGPPSVVEQEASQGGQ